MTVLLFLVPSAFGATLDVAADGSATYSSVGDAVDAAASGDTIEIAAGSYTECLNLGGRDLDLVGAGAGLTLLGGAVGCENLVEVGAGETVLLSGLSLTNASGRGAYVHDGSSLRLEDVEISDSGDSTLYGSGVYVDGSTLELSGGGISGNTAREGAAIYATNSSSVDIEGATIEDNTVVTNGAGIDVQWYSTLSVRDSLIVGNEAATNGGGVLLYAADAATFSDTVIQDNVAGAYGGGLEVEWYADVTLERVQVTGNTAVDSGGGLSFYYYLSASITDSEISGNQAGGSGGGVMFYPADTSSYDLNISGSDIVDNVAGADGGGVYAGWARQVHVQDSRLWRNSAGESGTGGGILVYVAEDNLLLRNDFCANTAGTGGGASIQWATLDAWRNNVFTGNLATFGGGGHRYVDYDSETLHNSFLGNSASSWGGAYYGSYAYSPFEHNLVADTVAGTGIYADDATTYANSPVSWSAWSHNEVVDGGGYFYVADGSDGNIVVDDAGLVSWSTKLDCEDVDARLVADSLLRDAGDPDGATDLDGSVADIGAYGGPDAPVEDHDGDGVDTTADCLDVDASVYPGATETCNGRDEDCNGVADNDAIDAGTWYVDADDDGFGGEAVSGCEQPEGTVAEGGDCDDADPDAYPGAEEVLDDGVDQDCDGADATTVGDTGDGGAEGDGGSAGDGGGDTGSDGGAMGDGGTDTGAGVADSAGDKGGCGCGGGGSAALWGLLPLVGVLGRRRRG